MKKSILLIFSLLMVIMLNAQQWTKNLPKEKSSSTYTFSDYQNAFYSYWEPYNLKGGFYIDENGNKTKAPGWKQFKRWEYFWETRLDPQTGQLSNIDLNALYKNEKRAAAFKSSGELWLSKGPNTSDGGYAGIGRINTIAYHPTNSSVFWVGTASGGLWVTSDGGQSWSVLNDDMQALGVSDIIIPSDYETSKTIYLATGDRDAFDTNSIGLLKSTDGGITWSSAGIAGPTSNNWIINRTLLNPADNKTLVVAGNFKTYKIKNGAVTKISEEVFIDMEFKPGDFNTLYGSTKNGDIFMSTNEGLTWVKSLDVVGGYRVELAVSPAQPTWVYAVVVNTDDGLLGIYKSLDSGISFTQIFDGSVAGKNLLGWKDGSDTGGQGWYDLAMVASPTNANTVFIGGINTWRSSDGGYNWTMINHWYGGFGKPEVHADKHYMGFQPVTNVFFEGNDGGIYKTSNYLSWTDLTNGIVNSQIYRLGTSATVPGETITGLQDNGTKLLESGNIWYDKLGGDGMECIIDYTNENIQYGSLYNGEIYKTSNRWQTDTEISANIPGGADGAWVTPYIMNPKDPKKLYVGYYEIWKTKDAGTSFTKISDFQGDYLRSLAISPSDTSTIYAATADYYTPFSQIFHTADGGQNWTDITGSLPVAAYVRITYIAVKNDDPNTVWVTLSGYSGNGVYESTNAGQTWTNIERGLPDIPCNTIVQNKLNTGQVELYVGTDIGAYLKLGSDPWVFYSTGLPNVVVNELEIYYDPINPNESKLKAATYGRGLWETKVYSVQTKVNTISNIGSAIYPNPSNGQFKLDFADYNGEEIEVEVRSLSGKMVYKNSFNNQSNIVNLGNLADGVYVLQLKKEGQWYGQSIVIQK